MSVSAHRPSSHQSSTDMTTAVDSSESTDETTVMDTVEPTYYSNETVVYADSDDVWCSKTDQFGTLPKFDERCACSNSLFDNKSKECDYFTSLFSADIVQNIVIQTNLYAEQTKATFVMKAGSKVQELEQTRNWDPITANLTPLLACTF